MPTDVSSLMKMGYLLRAATLRHCLPKNSFKKRRRTVIFDPRAVWAVENAVVSANGTPLLNRCGHSFIKTRMQETGALFAGEASGHYYFKDNFYTDNGMIPLLLILEYLSANRTSLAESVNHLSSSFR